jgi:cyclase
VKTVKFAAPKYIGDPVNTVRIFNEEEVDEVIFLDISATPEGREPQNQLIREIAGECFMPFAYGGGIRSLREMQEIFALGAEKVVLNSSVLERPELITEGAQSFGSQSIVVSIDVKRNWRGRYEVRTHGGRRTTRWSPLEWAREAENRGAGEILLTSIDRDGTMIGYDLDLIGQVSQVVDVPVVACGGAGNLKHCADAVGSGASAVAAGSLFVYQNANRSVLINFPTQDEILQTLEPLRQIGRVAVV